MSDRRYNVKDYLRDEIIPELREIDELSEQMYRKIPSNVEESANFELIRMRIENIKEIIGYYS